MDYIDFNKEIKQKKVGKIYLFNVEEDFIALSMINKLKKAYIKEETESLNYNVIESKNVDIGYLSSVVMSMPILDEKRIVVVKNESFLKNKQNSEKIIKLLNEIPSYTVVVFYVNTSIDKRTSIYKTIKEKGEIVDIPRLSSYTLSNWIRKKAKELSIKFDQEALNYLIEASGYTIKDSGVDLTYFISELSKLSNLRLEKEYLTAKDIKGVISFNINDEIFKYTDALRDENKKLAYEYYGKLVYNNTPFMFVLSIVISSLQTLYVAKEYKKKKLSQDDMVKDYKMHPYSCKIAMGNEGKFTGQDLKKSLYLCHKLEFMVKSGILKEEGAFVILTENISSRNFIEI